MLFSNMVDPENSLKIAIEMTAAGIADEKVNPTFKPRYTFDAVKIIVIKAPSIVPRSVSSRKLFIYYRKVNSICVYYILNSALWARSYDDSTN